MYKSGSIINGTNISPTWGNAIESAIISLNTHSLMNTISSIKNAIKGNWVLYGLAVTQRAAGANMSVDVGTGDAVADQTYSTKTLTTNVAVTAAHATLPRIDIVSINSAGTITVTAGTAATDPYPPSIPANEVILAEIAVAAATTSIVNANITDRRMLAPQKFPDNIGEIYPNPLHYTGACTIKNGYLTIVYNKDLWNNTDATRGYSHSRFAATTKLRRGYGTYQFKYYHTGKEANKMFEVGFFWSGICSYGGAYFREKFDGDEVTITSWNTGITETALADWTPSDETTLKIEWSASSVKYYVDGALKNTVNTNVPQEQLPLAWNIEYEEVAADFASNSWMFFKAWERIA